MINNSINNNITDKAGEWRKMRRRGSMKDGKGGGAWLSVPFLVCWKDILWLCCCVPQSIHLLYYYYICAAVLLFCKIIDDIISRSFVE